MLQATAHKDDARPGYLRLAETAISTNYDYADPAEVAVFARDLSNSYLQCRELSHNWKPWTAYAKNGGYERALRCTRCRTERWEVLTSTGAKVSGHYVYPDGYLHEGLGRIVGDGRDALRLESLTRTLVDAPSEGEKA